MFKFNQRIGYSSTRDVTIGRRAEAYRQAGRACRTNSGARAKIVRSFAKIHTPELTSQRELSQAAIRKIERVGADAR